MKQDVCQCSTQKTIGNWITLQSWVREIKRQQCKNVGLVERNIIDGPLITQNIIAQTYSYQIAKALIVVDTTNISRNGIKRSRILITPSYLCQEAGNNCQNATISKSEKETKKHVHVLGEFQYPELRLVP